MGKRHVVHESTTRAVLERLSGGQSIRALARELGSETLAPTLSDIVARRPNVSVQMEKRVRVQMGMPSRVLSASEAKRSELSRRLAAAGITWAQAMEIALSVVESKTKGEAK